MVEDRKKIIKWLEDILNEVHNDPNLRKRAEEYQRKYGTLTPEDLKKYIDTNPILKW